MGLLCQSLVLCNALLMGLPQGWCCVVPFQTAESQAPGTRSCPHCKQAAQTKSPSQKQEPVQPINSCRCQADMTGVKAAKTVLPDLSSALPVAVARADLLLDGGTVPDSIVCNVNSPPLQLIHCVWLC
jgi:hypothetical protein